MESITIGLAEGLSQLDGDEEYLFLTLRGEDDWLRPHLRGNARSVQTPGIARHGLRRLRAAAESRVPGARTVYRSARPNLEAVQLLPPASDGTLERLGVEVVHFLNQAGFLTALPSIYHPHDLQHRHLPEFFSDEERKRRDGWYESLSRQASMVAVASTWIRDDVIAQFGLPAEKVHVVPWAAPLPAAASSEPTSSRPTSTLALPDRFILYPAQTWAHKNHIGLVRAIGLLHRRDVSVPVVFTGRRTDHASEVDAAIAAEGVSEMVTWAGFVEPEELSSIYRRATAVVIPTRFEAASGPLWEAFAAGVPAACSRVTSLPEQAGDAALLFDPDDVSEMAVIVERLWRDESLRRELVERGRAQLAPFTWQRTARMFRAHYRRLAGRTLQPDDASLIASPAIL